MGSEQSGNYSSPKLILWRPWMISGLLRAIDTSHPLPLQHRIHDYCLFIDAFASLGFQNPIYFSFSNYFLGLLLFVCLVPFPPQLFVEGPTQGPVLCDRHSLEHPLQILWDAGLQHQALAFFSVQRLLESGVHIPGNTGPIIRGCWGRHSLCHEAVMSYQKARDGGTAPSWEKEVTASLYQKGS